MSNQVFIPSIWSARLLANLDKNLVYANLCNRDYEGEITGAGNIVKITALADIAVRDYASGTDMTTDDLDGSDLDLVIDQKKYFNFTAEDILKIQSKPELLDAAMQKAAYALRDTADGFVAGLYTEAAGAVGSDATPFVAATATEAYDSLVDIGIALTEQDVPTGGRYVVVPAWYEGLFRKDSRIIGTGDASSEATRISGYLGQMAGFSVFVSNNVANTAGAKYKIMAGNSQAISFAQQVLETESLRHQKRFADIVRGLFVYGAKVVQPKALAVLTASKS